VRPRHPPLGPGVILWATCLFFLIDAICFSLRIFLSLRRRKQYSNDYMIVKLNRELKVRVNNVTLRWNSSPQNPKNYGGIVVL
jgi:hypothetical protein